MTTTLRRGACPTLAEPMPTGDGLLARLPQPRAPLSADAIRLLAAAAREYGNGVIEVTSRGSLQIRGLRPETASGFAAAVAAIEPSLAEKSPVVVGPLAGLDPTEIVDVRPIAEEIRKIAAKLTLGPKVSIEIDGGGALHLDDLRADIKLSASRDGLVISSFTGRRALRYGTVPAARAADVAGELLGMIAVLGPEARADELDVSETLAITGSAEGEPLPARSPAEPIGRHALRGGTFAVGIGLPFGHTDATTLAALADTAPAATFMPAPGRALLVIGLDDRAASSFQLAASHLGFVVDPDDPRRFVIACTGAPACGSARQAARSIGENVAATLAPVLDAKHTIHISGCAKGCANARTSSLTLVGRDDGYGLIHDGRVADAPDAVVPAASLMRELSRIATRSREPVDAYG